MHSNAYLFASVDTPLSIFFCSIHIYLYYCLCLIACHKPLVYFIPEIYLKKKKGMNKGLG